MENNYIDLCRPGNHRIQYRAGFDEIGHRIKIFRIDDGRVLDVISVPESFNFEHFKEFCRGIYFDNEGNVKYPNHVKAEY